MKKALTLSELLITVAIIGVLIAIFSSTFKTPTQSSDKLQYKKALLTIQNAVSKAIDEVEEKASNPENGFKDTNFEKSDFCNSIASYLNITGDIDCESESTYEHPNFKTTDGIRYWGLEGGFRRTEIENEIEVTKYQDKETIFIDYNMKKIDRDARKERSGYDYDYGLKIDVYYDGKVNVDKDYTYETSLIND